jgi:hypothetical protein
VFGKLRVVDKFRGTVLGQNVNSERPQGTKQSVCRYLQTLNYESFVEDSAKYRAYLDELIEKHPELFPAEIIEGYCFIGFVESDKMHLRTRRIRLKSNRQAYQLRPDTVMPT